MPRRTRIDLAVIGAGPAGLAAAVKAKQEGVRDLVVFERDERPGGILRQCVHSGFGLQKFGEDLTGPEYANRYRKMAAAEGVDIELDTTALEITGNRTLTAVSAARGLRQYECRALILAMGCRERPRGAIGIPGTRPAGVYTAGQAQRLINLEGYMPGRKTVILGSGDIGLIMARRLVLEGAEVRAVVEALPYASGLLRNVIQCLRDFDIPLLLKHSVTEIHGEKRVAGVTIAEVNEQWQPVPGTARFLDCDTVLLAVGLIPENELSRMAGIRLDPRTGGPFVNDFLETNLPGVFSCGNVLHVNDLVDNVSAQGELAALGAHARISGGMPPLRRILSLEADETTIAQIVPQSLSGLQSPTLWIRVRHPLGKSVLKVDSLLEKKIPYARPSEMLHVRIPKKAFCESQEIGHSIRVSCKEV